MTRAGIVTAAIFLTHVMLTAQAPNFAGTWKLDAERSKVTPAAALSGLIPNGAPAVLHVTQPANGTLVVESQINEGQSRIYKPKAKTSTPVGQGGSITMLSTWTGRTIVSEGTVQAATGATTNVKESYTLSADGQTLTIDVTTSAGADTNHSTMTYVRTQNVGPCESWPTPCKRPKS